MSDIEYDDYGEEIPKQPKYVRPKVVRPDRRKIPKTEMEHHKGWIENLQNEERTMKDSIRKCIDDGFTADPVRAKEIMTFSFPESESGSSRSHPRHRTIDWKPAGPLGKEELKKHMNKKRVEGLMGDNIINNRLSPLPLEFFTKDNTQRMYHDKKTRALQSKISLKFPLATIDREKVRMKPNIK